MNEQWLRGRCRVSWPTDVFVPGTIIKRKEEKSDILGRNEVLGSFLGQCAVIVLQCQIQQRRKILADEDVGLSLYQNSD